MTKAVLGETDLHHNRLRALMKSIISCGIKSTKTIIDAVTGSPKRSAAAEIDIVQVATCANRT